MTILEAVIQGVIQGATEFLPVSSSGHLSISQHMFGIELPGILFDVMLHLGTLIAVVFVYRQLVWRLIKEFGLLCADLARGRFHWKEMNDDRRLMFMLIIGLLPLFLLFFPIPSTDMKVKDLSEQLASDSSIVAEGLALLATSLLLFLGIHANQVTCSARRAQDGHGKRVPPKGRRRFETLDAVIVGMPGGNFSRPFPVWLYNVCWADARHQPAGGAGLFLCAGHPLYCGGGVGFPKGCGYSGGEHWHCAFGGRGYHSGGGGLFGH